MTNEEWKDEEKENAVYEEEEVKTRKKKVRCKSGNTYKSCQYILFLRL
jgi:hypothetical protein